MSSPPSDNHLAAASPGHPLEPCDATASAIREASCSESHEAPVDKDAPPPEAAATRPEGATISHDGQAPQGKKKCRKPSKLYIGCIFMGQLMSFMCIVPGLFTEQLAKIGVSIPLFQSVLLYVMFLLFWTLPNVHRFFVHKKMDIVYYIIIGCLDVTQNTLNNAAFNYTTVASVIVLYNISIPASILFSWVIHKETFSWLQVVMGLVCFLATVFYTYIDELGKNDGRSSVTGDIMAILAGVFVGIESVINMYVTSTYSPYQWLARFAICGFVIALIIFLAQEYDPDVASGVLGRPMTWAYMAGYLIAMLLYYMIVPWLIGHSDAVLYNISFITASIYSFFFSHFMNHHQYSPLIAIPTIVIIAALIGYFVSPRSKYCCSIRTKKDIARERAALEKGKAGEGQAASRAPLQPITAGIDTPSTQSIQLRAEFSQNLPSSQLNDRDMVKYV